MTIDQLKEWILDTLQRHDVVEVSGREMAMILPPRGSLLTPDRVFAFASRNSLRVSMQGDRFRWIFKKS